MHEHIGITRRNKMSGISGVEKITGSFSVYFRVPKDNNKGLSLS